MKKVLLVLLCILFLSCNNYQERIEDLEAENYELREKISELEDEKEELENQISDLQEKLENAQSSIDDARFNLLNGNFGMGIDDLDYAESELDY